MQHFRLTLECGHCFEETAVDDYEGAVYSPNYIGRELPSPPVRCCEGVHKVTAQTKIPRLTGATQ